MAERRPIVLINGQLQELPTGDTLPGGGGGGSTTLDGLTDVTVTAPTNGQMLKYNGSQWVNDGPAEFVTMPGYNNNVIYESDTGYKVPLFVTTAEGDVILV